MTIQLYEGILPYNCSYDCELETATHRIGIPIRKRNRSKTMQYRFLAVRPENFVGVFVFLYHNTIYEVLSQ